MASAPPLRDRADACPGALQTHDALVGCERRCGRPSGAVVDVVATATGYRIG